MLAPAINTAKDLLTQALNEIVRLDKYANAADSIVLVKLQQEPAWLAAVRVGSAALGDAGVAWMMERPELWSTVLVQFTNYANAFDGVAQLAQGGKIASAGQWVDMLNQVLLPQLARAVAQTHAVELRVQKARQRFASIRPLLEASINEGWDVLAHEVQPMLTLAAALTELQDRAAALESPVTSAVIGSGHGVISSAVKTIYGIVADDGAAVSFLSLGAPVITVGKSFAELVAANDDIADMLLQIAVLQLQASEAAQAAAGTRLISQLADTLETSFRALEDVLPRMNAMWRAEQGKVQAAVEALQGGADPRSFFELFSVPVANANWQAINDFAMAIPGIKREVGKPVLLKPAGMCPV